MIQATVPLPLQIVIDDVGWWCGDDTSAANGPYRSGCPRPHVPADYQAIADLGRRLNMRPQAAMILAEWDRYDRLRLLPTSQWQGAAWDNGQWRGPWLDEAAAIISGNQDHFELVLHGVGHEYWADGRMTRAEWHDRERRLRPRDQVEQHLVAFGQLLADNGLGLFPESFVPAAFLHRFGSAAGLASLLAPLGIKYLSTPFGSMFRDRETEGADWGLDHGLLTVDRGRDLCNWNMTGPAPNGDLAGPICGMHWPNVLHEDPSRNGEVVERWVALLAPYNQRPDRMLSRNTAEAFTQLLVCRCGVVRVAGDRLELDLSALGNYEAPGLLPSFYLKLSGARERALVAVGCDVLSRAPVTGAPGQELLHLRRQAGQWRATLTLTPPA